MGVKCCAPGALGEPAPEPVCGGVAGATGRLFRCVACWELQRGSGALVVSGEQRGRGGFVSFKDTWFAGGARLQKDKGLKKQGDGQEP